MAIKVIKEFEKANFSSNSDKNLFFKNGIF